MNLKVGDFVFAGSDGRGQVKSIKNNGDVVVEVTGAKGPVANLYDAEEVRVIPSTDDLERAASFEFRSRHVTDFNPCDANVAAMTQYIRANGLHWDLDGLESAFTFLQRAGRLAPVSSATPAKAEEPTVPKRPALTKEDVAKMDGPTFWKAVRERPDELKALGIKI
jgi:hypothetical protein